MGDLGISKGAQLGVRRHATYRGKFLGYITVFARDGQKYLQCILGLMFFSGGLLLNVLLYHTHSGDFSIHETYQENSLSMPFLIINWQKYFYPFFVDLCMVDGQKYFCPFYIQRSIEDG